VLKAFYILLFFALTSHIQAREPIHVGVITVKDPVAMIFKLTSNSEQIHVFRLALINLPYHGQYKAKETRLKVRKLLEHKNASIQYLTRSNYSVKSAIVRIDGTNINAALIQGGFAWVDRTQTRDKRYFQWQEKARQHRLGIWLDDKPVHPLEFKTQISAITNFTQAKQQTTSTLMKKFKKLVFVHRKEMWYVSANCQESLDIPYIHKRFYTHPSRAEKKGYRLLERCTPK
jgi:micrococcal nuclease